MAEKDRFSDEEWDHLTAAPLAAAAAIVAVGHPGPITMLKELRAAGKTIKRGRKRKDLPAVVAEIVAVDPKEPLGNGNASDYEGLYEKSMAAVSSAGEAARKLTPDELDAYVDWVSGLGTATAEAVTDKGDDDPVSDTEREALQEIERRLRG